MSMTITFIGGGNMASALIGGLLDQGFAAPALRVVEPVAETREKLARRFGIECHAEIGDPLLECDVLLLAVKPQQMRAALQPLAGRLARPLVISIAAGIRLDDLSRWLGGYHRLVRAMPNTPALIGKGMSGLFATHEIDARQREQAQTILSAVGKVLWVGDEAEMDAITAISGSGPAYVFHFIEALRDAATMLGFDSSDATRLAVETVAGAAALAATSEEDVSVLRQRVTSPGGTTEAALKVLEAEGLRTLLLQAVRAAQARSQEMGQQGGQQGGQQSQQQEERKGGAC